LALRLVVDTWSSSSRIRKAKADLFAIDSESLPGEEIVIGRGKKPMVRRVALRDEDGNRKPGALKGRLFCSPDVVAPPTDRELKDLGFE
jgi:hypothetical protein